MQYRSFGKLGWNISSIGFGAWAIGGGWGTQRDDESVAALHAALDAGCNFIDTARGYGNGHSERVIGTVLKSRQGDRIYVATKIPPAAGDWPPSPYDRQDACYPEAHLRSELESSLRELKTDCIDLVQLHTWTRAWNDEPRAFELLNRFKQEGKIRAVGISTPEQDQHSVLDLVRNGVVDSVQLIFNIFEQEPAAQLLPLCQKHGVAVIVRVVFDEGSLTGKFTGDTQFEPGDFRAGYFEGDRLPRTVARVERIKAVCAQHNEKDLPSVALRFALQPSAVSTVIPGIRNVRQANLNCAASDQPPLSDELLAELRTLYWRRAFWYGGKK